MKRLILVVAMVLMMLAVFVVPASASFSGNTLSCNTLVYAGDQPECNGGFGSGNTGVAVSQLDVDVNCCE